MVNVETILLIVLVCVSLALIGLVLIQQGKGADAGASFGGGGSQTVFGGAGSGNFLTKSSWALAAVFFVICVALAYIAREKATGGADGISFEEEPVVIEQPVDYDVPQLDAVVTEESDVHKVDAVAEEVEPVVEQAEEAASGAAESVEAVSEDAK